MMQEILTRSGAVIHIDDSNPAQTELLDVVVTAFGGIAIKQERVA